MAQTQHSGKWAILGALMSIFGVVTQPGVAAQIGGKTGAILGALGVFGPLVSAAIGAVGGVTAAAAMPPGSPKIPTVPAPNAYTTFKD